MVVTKEIQGKDSYGLQLAVKYRQIRNTDRYKVTVKVLNSYDIKYGYAMPDIGPAAYKGGSTANEL